jgi:hypothetical protein
MKKLITCLLLFTTLAIGAQEMYWTGYSFIVEPENEATVAKLISDYFKDHKTEGVTVSLYSNHFRDGENTATHEIVFSGTLDALGGMYAADGGDAWDLLGARLDHHIEDGAGARMGSVKTMYGDTEGDYPIQQIYVLDVKDGDAMEKALTKFNTDFKPEGRVVMMGDITSGQSTDGENHWALVGYKDFKSAMGGSNAGLTDKQKAARAEGWKTFGENNGGVRMVRSFLRVRVGTW